MIGDDLDAALPELQAHAESRMRSVCLIRRPTGTTADPVNGADVTVYQPGAVYSGKCRIKTRDVQVLVAESAQSTVSTQRYELHIPVGAGTVRVGDVASVGLRKFRIDGLHQEDNQTAQRLPVTETTSGA